MLYVRKDNQVMALKNGIKGYNWMYFKIINTTSIGWKETRKALYLLQYENPIL